MADGETPQPEKTLPPPGQETSVEAGGEQAGAEPKESLLQLGETYEAAADRQPEAYRGKGREHVATTVANTNARIDAISKSPGLNLPAVRLG